MHGEVERCNWDPWCVAEWDANTAAFEALSPEEQAGQVAFKQAEDAKLMQAQFPIPEMPVAMPGPMPDLPIAVPDMHLPQGAGGF